MLNTVDYFFNYKYIARFILLHKSNCFFNTHELPLLRGLLFYFSISGLEDLDDVRTFNYFYIFRFFLGNKSFFTKFKSDFRLGHTFYSFHVQSFFSGRFCFFPVSFLVNDVLSVININTYSYFCSGSVFCMSFYDLNFFLEKKNNLGLFNLKNVLNCKLFFSSIGFSSFGLLLRILKII